jgi:hypothetical protein
MSCGAVSVADTATKIISANCNRQALILVNNSSDTVVYIGADDSVTIANGIPLYTYMTKEYTKAFGFYNGDIYGIVTSGTADVRYWEMTQ